MKKNTVFLKAAGKAAGLPALLLAVGLAASVSLALAGCDNGDGEEGGGNTLPTAKGVNALSGKTYFDYSEKIAFSATAEGAANGTFTIGSAVWKDGANNWELENGKYKYFPSKTGYYSWDATAKTVTISPEKIANRNNGVYGPLETKAAYRAAVQKMLDDYKKERGEAWLNEQLASMGFSSVAAYLDYAVAEDFKNVIYNYAFSADNKALFLDEPLPASKGANELTGLTFNGTRDGNDDVKDDSQTYVFTATGCTETGEGGYSQTYTYTYNSSEKMVYLKTPTEDRDARYNADNTNSGYFDSADAYNAAQVNNQYNRLEKYKYDTAKKLLQRR